MAPGCWVYNPVGLELDHPGLRDWLVSGNVCCINEIIYAGNNKDNDQTLHSSRLTFLMMCLSE